MRNQAAAAGLGVLLALVPVACGDDDAESERSEPEDAVAVEDAIPVRSEERSVAGLPTLVVRPIDPGPWPLLLYVHDAGSPPASYGRLLRDLAAGGYVVVAPSMPGSVDQADASALLSLPFQPGRLRQVLAAVTSGPGAIAAADPEHVVAAGHSLGAMTALAVAFNTCCTDSRIDAVVSFSGGLATFPGGRFHSGTVPLLLVHGDADDVVPHSSSAEALQLVGTSAYLLTVEGGDHETYLRAGAEAYPAVRDATLAFLMATVGERPQAGLADLATAATGSGVQLTSRG